VDLESIYLRLPVPLQHVACSAVGWRTEHTPYGGEFQRILGEAEERGRWANRNVDAFRDRRLSAVVDWCARTVPYYAELFAAAGLAPAEVRTLDDLALLPVMTKSDAQEHARGLVSTSILAGKTRTVHTSGTTGAALRFPVTLEASQEQWAVWWRYRGWHGIERGTWCGLFAGRSVVPAARRRPPFWRVNRPGRQLLFSGYHVSDENLPAYVDELRRRRLPWLHGYPSLLALLAGHLVETGRDLGYDVQWVTTGAENLLPHQAAVIERAFGVGPIQHYGLAEGVANMSQCEAGRLHVDEDYAAVEFVPTGHDGLHRIVGTSLTNLAAPLLRYDTQDLASVAPDGSCSCGRPGRVVDRVDGRLEDYVVLRNGVRIGRMDHIFKDMVNVKEAQIRQAVPGEMVMCVVRGLDYTEADEHMLLEEAAKRVGDDMRIEVEYVPELPRTATGKLRFVQSDVEGASIEQLPQRALTD
jgi:phenylacetate-coenzyme A ligase PaaK-like adenylate-forming protein